jgi:hypothetical protein
MIGRELPWKLSNITDRFIREHFDFLRRFFDEDLFSNFRGKFYTLTYTANGTYTFNHSLGFLPRDVVQTSVKNATVVWNYASFTDTVVSFTISAISGTCEIRAFVGTYGGKQ